jgi:diacylglycerol kinase family enzyme
VPDQQKHSAWHHTCGSANGMAKEIGIPADIHKALNLALSGNTRSIHLIKVNNEYCIHLADIGFNAFVIKKFETSAGRGMWGYFKRRGKCCGSMQKWKWK